jgi:2,4-diketo-3-deoxy-L-fuconate hydrolase
VKLIRVGDPGHEVSGVLTDDDRILDASAIVADIDAQALSPSGLAALVSAVKSLPEMKIPPTGLRLGPPVARPEKVVCIGVNYPLKTWCLEWER